MKRDGQRGGSGCHPYDRRSRGDDRWRNFAGGIPAAGLLDYFRGKALVLINKGATPQDRNADLLIQKPIGQIFSQMKVRGNRT